MGRVSRLFLGADAVAIVVALGLVACARPSGNSAPSARPDDGGGRRTQPSPAMPVEGGKTGAALGIETKGGTFTPLIDRGTAVPASRREIFTTSEDNQATIRINVYRGVSHRVADAQRVGGYALTVPNPGPRGVPQLSVTFDIDAAGAFRLTATDSITEAPVTVSPLD